MQRQFVIINHQWIRTHRNAGVLPTVLDQLDGSVNSSFGSQLNKGMNQFPPGTVFGGVRLPEP